MMYLNKANKEKMRKIKRFAKICRIYRTLNDEWIGQYNEFLNQKQYDTVLYEFMWTKKWMNSTSAYDIVRFFDSACQCKYGSIRHIKLLLAWLNYFKERYGKDRF